MKYGDYFESESVPRWSPYNIDYISLKQQIKLNTTRNQATAIAIPGQNDVALEKFECSFYDELENQHDRVDLFVTGKADEISRRLEHLEELVHRALIRCSRPGGLTPKMQRRLARLQQHIFECGDDSRDLERFVHAQVVAFQKILKKYRKWTGSTTLGTRFRTQVLGDQKSFTRRDFEPLQEKYREILTTLQASSPGLTTPASPASPNSTVPQCRSPRVSRRPSAAPVPPKPAVRYFNEYDDGSEGGQDDTYGIYVNSEDTEVFPGLSKVGRVIMMPVNKLRSIIPHNADGERRSLLHSTACSRTDYSSTLTSHAPANHTDTEATDEDTASSIDYPRYGYSAHYAALPSIEEQRVERYREMVLHHTMIASFIVAMVLLLTSGVLVATGRHKLRLEVDAGVILAVVTSLFASCTGLGAMLYREDRLGCVYHLMVWTSFVALCVLNGILLVIVVGSTVTYGQ